jgi:hypothetical protein
MGMGNATDARTHVRAQVRVRGHGWMSDRSQTSRKEAALDMHAQSPTRGGQRLSSERGGGHLRPSPGKAGRPVRRGASIVRISSGGSLQASASAKGVRRLPHAPPLRW